MTARLVIEALSAVFLGIAVALAGLEAASKRLGGRRG